MSNLRIRRVYPGRDMSEMAVRYEPVTTEQLARALFEATYGWKPQVRDASNLTTWGQAQKLLDILDRTV